MKRLKKLRFILVYPLALGLFLFAHTTERSLLIGALVVALGEALRLWANSYVGHVKVNRTQQWRGDAKIGQLITAGPYAYVRHPLYLGTFLIGMGFCIVVDNVWMALVALGFFLLVYRHKMAKEEAILLDEWGETFERYQRAVPRWLPTGTRYALRTGEASWAGIRASREFKTVLWVTVVLLLLYFREELIQEHGRGWSWRSPKHLALIAATVGLMLSDGLFELRRLWRQRAAPKA